LTAKTAGRSVHARQARGDADLVEGVEELDVERSATSGMPA